MCLSSKQLRRLKQEGSESQGLPGLQRETLNQTKQDEEPATVGLQFYMRTHLFQLCALVTPFVDTQPPPHCGVCVSAPLGQAGPGNSLLLPLHSWHSPRPDGIVGDPRPARPSLIWQWEKFPLSSHRNLEKLHVGLGWLLLGVLVAWR